MHVERLFPWGSLPVVKAKQPRRGGHGLRATGHHRLSWEAVCEIRAAHEAGHRVGHIAKMFNIHETYARAIILGDARVHR